MQNLQNNNAIPPTNALHVFGTNAQVDNYNALALNALNGTGIIVEAHDLCNTTNEATKEFCLQRGHSLSSAQLNGLRKS